MFNSTVSEKKGCSNSKYWWSDDLGTNSELWQKKKIVYKTEWKNEKTAKTKLYWIKKLKIKYNKLRREIEIEKLSNMF